MRTVRILGVLLLAASFVVAASSLFPVLAQRAQSPGPDSTYETFAGALDENGEGAAEITHGDSKTTGDEGGTIKVLDNADAMYKGAREMVRRQQGLCMLMASTMLALGIMISLAGEVRGVEANPGRVIGSAMIGTIGIMVYPWVMDQLDTTTTAIAKWIDTFQFQSTTGQAASATVRVWHGIEEAIGKSIQSADWWTLLTSPISSFLWVIAFVVAIIAQTCVDFGQQVGWLFLLIAGPWSLSLFSTGTQWGANVAKGCALSAVVVASVKIPVAVVYFLLDLGIRNFAQDPQSVGIKAAVIGILLALSIFASVVWTKNYLSGGGLDTNAIGFANQMLGMMTVGAIGIARTLGSQIPVLGRVADRMGEAAQGLAGGGSSDGAGGTSPRSVNTDSPKKVAPLPGLGAPHAAGAARGGRAAAHDDEQPGFWSAAGAVGGATLATAGNMLVAAQDLGNRDAGHIRTGPWDTYQKPKPARRHGSARGAGSGAGGTTAGDDAAGDAGSPPPGPSGPGTGGPGPAGPGTASENPPTQPRAAAAAAGAGFGAGPGASANATNATNGASNGAGPQTLRRHAAPAGSSSGAAPAADTADDGSSPAATVADGASSSGSAQPGAPDARSAPATNGVSAGPAHGSAGCAPAAGDSAPPTAEPAPGEAGASGFTSSTASAGGRGAGAAGRATGGETSADSAASSPSSSSDEFSVLYGTDGGQRGGEAATTANADSHGGSTSAPGPHSAAQARTVRTSAASAGGGDYQAASESSSVPGSAPGGSVGETSVAASPSSSSVESPAAEGPPTGGGTHTVVTETASEASAAAPAESGSTVQVTESSAPAPASAPTSGEAPERSAPARPTQATRPSRAATIARIVSSHAASASHHRPSADATPLYTNRPPDGAY